MTLHFEGLTTAEWSGIRRLSPYIYSGRQPDHNTDRHTQT